MWHILFLIILSITIVSKMFISIFETIAESTTSPKTAERPPETSEPSETAPSSVSITKPPAFPTALSAELSRGDPDDLVAAPPAYPNAELNNDDGQGPYGCSTPMGSPASERRDPGLSLIAPFLEN